MSQNGPQLKKVGQPCVKGTVKLFFCFCYVLDADVQVCWKTEREKLLVIDFHISVTQCEKKYTAFAHKLLQIPTKSIILTNCNLQQKALYYRLYMFD